MKPITLPARVRKATNCDGPEQWFIDQDFEVEAEDVGKVRDHYLGYRHKSYTVRRDDVGRHLRVTTQGEYRCWSFIR